MGKRSADADAEADPSYLYAASGYGYGLAAPHAYGYGLAAPHAYASPYAYAAPHAYAAVAKTPDHAVVATPFGYTHSSNAGICTNVNGEQVPC